MTELMAVVQTVILLMNLIQWTSSAPSSAQEKSNHNGPNIIMMLADDMGWNDVSFHGSNQIPTPNIDALAYNGVILNRHYTAPLCTPSRAAFLTGRYPSHTGMQHLVILENEPWGLPLNETLLPQHLAKGGYTSHIIGKWHLGFFRQAYTPTQRGFKTHYGYWQGFHDYYSHLTRATQNASVIGYDMKRNLNPDWSAEGHYSTDLFTNEAVNIINSHDQNAGPLFLYLAHLAPHSGNPSDPFQAPDNELSKFAHIKDPERRTYAAMVSKLDESVGEVVSALKEKGMLENSIIVFLSDNGAPTFGIHSNRGSNYPLRGIKNSAYEGASRCVGAVWSPLFKSTQRVSNQLMHLVDWLPTFYSAAGLDPKELGNIDGIDMWKALSTGEGNPRQDLLYNIDVEPGTPYGAVRKGSWKLIKGAASPNHDWYGEERDTSNSSTYNVQDIINSKVGTTISGFVTKQQIFQIIRERGGKTVSDEEKVRWRLLDEPTVELLREEATVSCNLNGPTTPCNATQEPCLFNIEVDPCERNNQASDHPEIVKDLELLLERYQRSLVPARNIPGEDSADPIYWSNVWVCWHDELDRLHRLDSFKVYGLPIAAIVLGIGLIICMLIPRNYLSSNKVVAMSGPNIKTSTLDPSVFTVECSRETFRKKLDESQY